MLTPEQIERIEAFDGQGARVLSVYLDVDPPSQVRRSYRIVFEDMVKDAREKLEGPARRELEAEAARVQEWLESRDPHGRALAMFSCAPRKFWEAHELHVGIENHLAFEPKADVAPLWGLLDEHERYAVALVDKERARLFTVFLGEIEESESLKEDFTVGKHDQGGISQARYQRHHDTHVHWHLKRVVEHLSDLLRRRRFDRLILAGPEEATSELRRLLPRALAQRLAAVIPGELFATEAEILHKTLEIERQIEREVEERLLEQLLETVRAGGRATCGVTPTLQALWIGSVQALVVSAGVHPEGSECSNCGQLWPGILATCPSCDAPMRPVHDLFHRAIEHAHAQAARVEVVHGDVARRLQEAGGGLGALLRFR